MSNEELAMRKYLGTVIKKQFLETSLTVSQFVLTLRVHSNGLYFF